jgi:excisionase family DNA binding protein
VLRWPEHSFRKEFEVEREPSVLPELLTFDEVAERLTVSVTTVRRAIAQGALPYVRVSDNRVAVTAADLAAYIASHRFCRDLHMPGPQLPDRVLWALDVLDRHENQTANPMPPHFVESAQHTLARYKARTAH